MDSWALHVFVFWPAVTIIAALINMLIAWTFSWSELILDYLVGIALGATFFFGTEPNADAAAKVMLVFSHGAFGIAGALGADRGDLFWSTAILTLVATALSGGLDRATLAIGREQSAGNAVLSIFILLLKMPFSLVTTTIAMLFVLVGSIRALAGAGRVGFRGGVVAIEWNPGASYASATTLGATVQVWQGAFSALIDHELYHSRQYVYLRDWLIPFWLFGGLWGWISAAAAGTFNIKAFSAAKHDREIGNPLERAAYRISGFSPF